MNCQSIQLLERGVGKKKRMNNNIPASPLFLYNLTLVPSTNITKCCYGSFSGDKKHGMKM